MTSSLTNKTKLVNSQTETPDLRLQNTGLQSALSSLFVLICLCESFDPPKGY